MEWACLYAIAARVAQLLIDDYVSALVRERLLGQDAMQNLLSHLVHMKHLKSVKFFLITVIRDMASPYTP
jgi:siderophore synthetase component